MMSTRSGVTLYMILAMVLGLVIIGTTFALNAMRKILPPPFLLEQKADYQMESAFVFCLSRLNDLKAASDEPLVRQEIAPGAWLTVTAKPAGNDEWILDARVKAESWTRTLSARAVRTPAVSRPPQAAENPVAVPTASETGETATPVSPTSHGAPASRWRIFFLPPGEGATPPPGERANP
ncbi:MAG TPA: hypothetical protein PLU72_04465 [Candidatus Ozemobacteraceae bacterium]|nr:hypothetical protein [Candidatus Ozemobacteraceae bacterium]